MPNQIATQVIEGQKHLPVFSCCFFFEDGSRAWGSGSGESTEKKKNMFTALFAIGKHLKSGEFLFEK